MKIFSVFAVLMFTAATLVSCKKEKSEPSIVGTWVGKFAEANDPPQYHYAFNMLSNGTLQRIDQNGNITGTGTWELNGIDFKATYVYENGNYLFSLAGLYTDFNGEIIGTWGFGDSVANGGTYFLQKQ